MYMAVHFPAQFVVTEGLRGSRTVPDRGMPPALDLFHEVLTIR
jgi:hypothetical protein